MANVNKLERMQLEIDKKQSTIDSAQNQLKIMKDRLGKEKDKEVLRMVKEQGLEPDQLGRILKAYTAHVTGMIQRKEAAHGSDETQN